MDLKRYRGEGGGVPRNDSNEVEETLGNRFIIQQNQAGDFNFEFKLGIKDKNNNFNILYSWIIPKNISLEPEVKRLAIKVENSFGNKLIEAEKNKNIIVWDKGRWGLIRGDIETGNIAFNLFGEIVKARYTIQKLVETKDKKKENHWVIWRMVGY